VNPARTALIVVDMQNAFVKDGGALVVPGAGETIPEIQNLLALARELGMKVIFTQDTYDEGDPEWEIWPEHVRKGSWGWQIVDELQPLEGELVIRKVRYDAFYGTHLDHCLRVWGVDTLIICGTVAQHLRPLHRRQRRLKMVQGDHTQRRHLSPGPLRPGSLSAPDRLPV
jgi:nicotinamidase-related amidase